MTTGHRTWTFVPGPDLHQHPAGGRDQPHAAQDAVGAARGDAGTLLHGARQSATRSPPPFFVLATQNPIELEGTYPLPEAQLDRFLFNTMLDYLSADEEMQVLDLTTTTHTDAGRRGDQRGGDSRLPANWCAWSPSPIRWPATRWT